MSAKIILNNTNNVATIKAEGDLFIIPNGIRTLEDINISTRHDIKKVCEMNGIKIPEDESQMNLIELWAVSEDLDCDNLADHSIYLDDIDGFSSINKELIDKSTIRILYPGRSIHFIPVDIFKDKKEGDAVNIKFPYTIEKSELDDIKENDLLKDFIFDMDFTLCQRKYRYNSFGDFEDVLHRLMSR